MAKIAIALMREIDAPTRFAAAGGAFHHNPVALPIAAIVPTP
jgi:hypothetical protein